MPGLLPPAAGTAANGRGKTVALMLVAFVNVIGCKLLAIRSTDRVSGTAGTQFPLGCRESLLRIFTANGRLRGFSLTLCSNSVLTIEDA
jgi:hypothetical protein